MGEIRDRRWKLRYQWEIREHEIATHIGGDTEYKDNISEPDLQ